MGAAGYITYELLGDDPGEAIEYLVYLDKEVKVPISMRLPLKTLARLDAVAGTIDESRARCAAILIDSAIDHLVRGSMSGPLDGFEDLAGEVEEHLRHAYEESRP